ncbi:MAG: NACHT domain-containing protein, partial [Verrucomicrobia bacterium]|nr:NACHT domain-containing protein [Verrucomicrobiota bacterium]
MGTLTLPTAEPPLTDDFIEPHRENVLIYYLGDVVDWHGYVKFLSLAALRETSTDVSLEKLFVEPSVAREHLLPDALEVVMPEVTPLSTALAQNPRLILLGDPGSGKSTALNWICVSLSRGGESILAQQLGGPLVPVPFVLRELGLGQEFVEVRDRAKRWDQLLQLFLARPVASHLSQERYKHKRFEESILGRMLSSGQALLLLDGIDEIGSLEVRTALREAVIEGMRRYPRCRWMLTSRIVGYEDVRFDRAVLAAPSVADLPQPSLREDRDPILDTMERFYIAPFNDAQIQQFAALWWRVHERNPYLANVRPAEFLEAVKQTQGVRSLARIPHLLTMVALIYRSRAELPDGRALLYSFIADAYLGTLDKERRLEHLRPIPHSADEMRGWLAVVGWHLQRRRGVQVKPAQPSEGLIDSVELLNLLTGVIQPKPGDDASGVATLFLDYVGRRSGLLMPRGKNEL